MINFHSQFCKVGNKSLNIAELAFSLHLYNLLLIFYLVGSIFLPANASFGHCFQNHHEEGSHRVPVAQAHRRGSRHPRVHHSLRREHEAEVRQAVFVVLNEPLDFSLPFEILIFEMGRNSLSICNCSDSVKKIVTFLGKFYEYLYLMRLTLFWR